jgi:hypothetical protein
VAAALTDLSAFDPQNPDNRSPAASRRRVVTPTTVTGSPGHTRACITPGPIHRASPTAKMRTAASVLRPGGRLVLVDTHPLFNMAASVDPLQLDFPYVNDGPRRFDDQGGSYADAVTEHNVTIECPPWSGVSRRRVAV